MSYSFELSNRRLYLRENSIKDHIDICCDGCEQNIEDENFYVGKPKAVQMDYDMVDAEEEGKRKIKNRNKHYHQTCFQVRTSPL